MIVAHAFYHSGLPYTFRYHLPKIELLCQGYPSLIRYLKDMKDQHLDELFEKDKRCSQLPLTHTGTIEKQERYNHACKLAGLALNACMKTTERHETVETFMLVNDSCTIACEVPVWFWEKQLQMGICGHIDIVQIRQGKIFVLDYKPHARAEKEEAVVSQLSLYATGLSFRTSIPLAMFRCGCFDEQVYYEFTPLRLFSTHVKINRPEQ